MPMRFLEYAWLVEKVRQNQKVANNIEAAVDAAVDEMPDSFELKAFLVANRADEEIAEFEKQINALAVSG